MKTRKSVLLSVVLSAVCAFGATVKKPAIVPEWSGAQPQVWTMDRAAALDGAKRNGKWTLVLVSGAWWCPWCQPLEEKVLDTPAWEAYAAASGFYEVLLDFPARNGIGYFCWLWETGYQQKVAKLTPEEATAALIGKFAEQNAYSKGGSCTTNSNRIVSVDWDNNITNRNWEVYAPQPETVYNRVGYPTLIVINPEGEEMGRFSPYVRDGFGPDGQEKPGKVWSNEEAFLAVSNQLAAIMGRTYVKVSVEPGCEGLGTVTEIDEIKEANVTVNLKATPGTGNVFAGWYRDGEPLSLSVDYRTPTASFKTAGGRMIITARFVTKAVDAAEIGIACKPAVPGYSTTEEMSLPIDVSSHSKPTVSVSTLPSGLRMIAPSQANDWTASIAGTPTKPGIATKVTITAKNTSGTKKEDVVIRTLDARSERLPDLLYDIGYTFIPGAVIDITNVLKASTMAEIGTNKNWSVTGLPAGMSWNSSKRTITGSPTKELASYTVTFTLKEGTKTVDLATVTFMTTEFPETVLEPWFDYLDLDPEKDAISTNGWKLAGGKACAAGTALSLSATAPRKATGATDEWVFAGWYSAPDTDCALENGTQDWRLASSYKFTTLTNDVTLYGRFVPKSMDQQIFIDFEPQGEYEPRVEMKPLEIGIDSLSTISSVTASGLPSGTKLVKPTGTNLLAVAVVGSPDPGLYRPTLTIKNQSATVTTNFEMTVKNLSNAKLNEDLGEPLRDQYGPDGLMPGALVDGDGTFAALAGKGWSVTKLPGSMKFDPQTGTLSGAPGAPGRYTVWFTKGTDQATTTFEVGPLPDLTLKALVLDENGEVEAVDPEGFRFAGAGAYAANTTNLLSVVSQREEYAFFGWYDASTNAIAQSPTDYRVAQGFACPMPEVQHAVVYALFAPKSMDWLVCDDLGSYVMTFKRGTRVESVLGGDYTYLPGMISSGSMPTVESVGTSKWPAGLSIDPKTLNIVGTPMVSGKYEIEVKVSNASGFESTQWLFIEVYDSYSSSWDPGYPVSYTGVVDPWNFGINCFSLYMLEPGLYLEGPLYKFAENITDNGNLIWGARTVPDIFPSAINKVVTQEVVAASQQLYTGVLLEGTLLEAGKYSFVVGGKDDDGTDRTSTITAYIPDSPCYWLHALAATGFSEGGQEPPMDGSALGRVSGGNCVAKPGREMTISAVAEPGYVFDGWYVRQDEYDEKGEYKGFVWRPVEIPGSDFDYTKSGPQTFIIPSGDGEGSAVLLCAHFSSRDT